MAFKSLYSKVQVGVDWFDVCFCLQGPQSDNLKHLRGMRPKEAYHWLHNRRVKAFYSVTTAPDFRCGVQNLLQVRWFFI